MSEFKSHVRHEPYIMSDKMDLNGKKMQFIRFGLIKQMGFHVRQQYNYDKW